MNITLNIQAESPAELQEAITGLAGIIGTPQVTLATEPAEEKPKKTSRKKAEKQPEPESEPEVTDTDVDSDTEDIPTVVDLREKAQVIGKTADGKKAIKTLLNEFESKSISDIPEDKRAAFLARLEDLGE